MAQWQPWIMQSDGNGKLQWLPGTYPDQQTTAQGDFGLVIDLPPAIRGHALRDAGTQVEASGQSSQRDSMFF